MGWDDGGDGWLEWRGEEGMGGSGRGSDGMEE